VLGFEIGERRLERREDVIVSGRDLKVGSIFRNWRIVEEIGRGGMGVVYLARHQLVGRHAAMKVLLAPADMRADESGMKRFQIEADLHFSLRHPNVPEFYDADLLEDGTAILIIEYLDGYERHEPRKQAFGSKE
jgi:serine/threonine-protein kinase